MLPAEKINTLVNLPMSQFLVCQSFPLQARPSPEGGGFVHDRFLVCSPSEYEHFQLDQ